MSIESMIISVSKFFDADIGAIFINGSGSINTSNDVTFFLQQRQETNVTLDDGAEISQDFSQFFASKDDRTHEYMDMLIGPAFFNTLKNDNDGRSRIPRKDDLRSL
jgi:stress response protein SCP2